MAYYIGLDLGGTNIKSGIVDSAGKLLAKISTPTNKERGADTVIAGMADGARRVAAEAGIAMEDVAGVGIGSPGPIDFEKGVVIDTPNLPGFKNLALRDRIAEATGRPSVLENDANAAAFGEYWAGAAKGDELRNVVMLTLGTGVGSGLIVDGKLLHGARGLGGEGGHMIVEPDGRLCGCGQRGCVEAYASASHTAKRAEEAVDADSNTSLAQLDRPLTAKQVFDAAMAGDALATRVVDETAEWLGVACVSFCRLLDPQVIVFAGGMILAGDFLFDRIRDAFKRHSWRIAEDHVRIIPAQLGNDAGVIGAAGVAWDAFQ